MSYDISLKDPVTRETIQLPYARLMTGGMMQVDYDSETGRFTPKPNKEAWLNITYNYARYYYEATEGDARFAHEEVSSIGADGKRGPMQTKYGIRGIYGKTGAESVPMLEDVIRRIEGKYKDENGGWITTERKSRRLVDNFTGKEVSLDEYFYMVRNGDNNFHWEEFTERVSEGDTSGYWKSTAANALRPLHQLIAMAKLRPDGIWDGD